MTDKLYFGETTARRLKTKPNTSMRTLTLKKLGLLCSLGAALLAGSPRASAQLSVGPSGLAPQTFDTQPPAASWSTLSVAGAVGDIADAATMDAAVQLITAASVTTQLPGSAATPPAALGNGQWASTGRYILTRPTGNRYNMIMATLRNNSGTNLSGIVITYGLTNLLPVTEQVPSHSAYFSLTGAAGSWQKLTALSGLSTSGEVSTNLSLGSWAQNSNLYILWSDDNGSGSPDTAVIIDNFAVSFPFPAIITHPQNSTVAPGQSVTLTVVASGTAPLFYQWLKNGGVIANATNSSYTINNAVALDAGSYSVIVSNAFGTALSSNALLAVNCSAPASFTTAPADQTLNPGSLLTLSAVVGGTSPITYQWAKNGVPIAGATNATYLKANVQSADSGLYTVTVNNCAELPNSASAVVSIADSPYVLMGLTNQTWKYEQSGTDLGTAWRATNYTDTAWPSGRALLAVEDNGALVPLINTTLSLGTPQRSAYYFRTTFVLTNDPATISVVSSNYFDDGAVVYINGQEAFRYNMQAGLIGYATLAQAANPAGEGVFIVSNIPPNLLIQGTNTVAVEVHQNSLTSSDIDFGMALLVNFFAPTVLSITNQPQSVAAVETTSPSFTLGLQGQPAFFQWYKNGVAVPGANATKNPFTLSAITTNDAGNYFVIASNAVNSVTSSVVTLTVITDTNGPVLVAADGTTTNTQVLATFSELLLPSTVTNANFRVTNSSPPGGLLTISSVLHTNGSNVLITTSTPRLANNNYILIVNNVRDTSPRTNAIIPNSAMPITSRVLALPFTAAWKFHDPFPPFDVLPPDLGTAWKEFTYAQENDMSDGNGVFYVTPDPGTLPGPAGTLLGETPSITSYFRTRFNLSASPANLRFNLTHIIEDGGILYLNGSEFLRVNMPAGAVNYLTLPSSTIGNVTRVGPLALTLPSYQVGTNVIAGEIHQPQINDLDKFFGVELEAIVESYTNGPVVILGGPSDVSVFENQPATFSVASVGGVTFQWQTNSVNVGGATTPTYTIPVVTTNMEGMQVRVGVANGVSGTVFSTNARVHVIIDSNAPVLLSGYLTSANTVRLSFSELMATGPAQTIGNYLVTNTAGGAAAISSAVLNNGTNVTLTFGSVLSGTYVVVVNNLTDASSRANAIAPNSAVTVGAEYLLSLTNAWKYLLVNTNEEIQTSYFAPNYDDSAWRGPSNALLYVEGAGLPAAKNTALDLFADPPANTARINTFYFRQKFVAPLGGSNVLFRIRHVIDDGVILYLNGVEIFRYNMPAGTLTAAGQATAAIGDATLIGPQDVVAALLSGTNVLAAEVHQSGATSSDVVFGIELAASIPSAALGTPEPVRIVEQPRSRTNLVTSTAFFRSTAAGALPITLQWYKNGTAMPGETNILLTVTNVSAGSMTNYYLRAANSFSAATSLVAQLIVTNGPGGPDCTNLVWQPGFRLGTNGLRTSVTYSNGTTRAVLRWTNPLTNTCGSNATVILQRAIGLRTPSANTLWTNVYTNVFGSATVTNTVAGTNTLYYRLSVP